MSEWQILGLLVGVALIVLAGRIRRRSLARHRPLSRPPRSAADPPARAGSPRPRPGLSPIQETQGAGLDLPVPEREEPPRGDAGHR